MTSPSRKKTIRILLYIWVLPNSLIGLSVGLIGVMSGGGYQVRRGCLEFYGGFVTFMLKRIGVGQGVLAMTLGHTIIGQDQSGLDLARDHEQVHVVQYERWGPIFIPAYLSCSACLWLLNKDAYRDNPFEVEAYRLADPHRPHPGDEDSGGT
jgi:hypothetical protein